MFVREVQFKKVLLPIDVTLFGMVTEVREQLSKALAPIDVTPLGIAIDVRDVQ